MQARKAEVPPPAPATITKEARALHALLNKAVEWGIIDRNPLAGMKPPPERSSKAPEFYSKEELERLYAASPNHADIWRFFVNTGLRRNEALNLRMENIGTASIKIESTEAAPTKSRRWRSVPINPTTRRAIDALTKPGSEYLLLQVAPRSLTRAFETCARRAGLKGSLHTLRHTFISHLVMAGVDLATVQKIAGHAAITTTMRYAHLTEAHTKEAVQRIAL